ncbi:MAG: hypothetical protein A2X36_04090 [Elusimicrobia bacterium GWA2_69_24]|nr:MAG: hypothetical protein A2X36_04090 [Elusimicrobia bacterium GWA2_69_24]HBL17868.1 hypothetical protein [Elusimicrobiota bacterium]
MKNPSLAAGISGPGAEGAARSFLRACARAGVEARGEPAEDGSGRRRVLARSAGPESLAPGLEVHLSLGGPLPQGAEEASCVLHDAETLPGPSVRRGLALPLARMAPDPAFRPHAAAGVLARLCGLPIPEDGDDGPAEAFRAGGAWAGANLPELDVELRGEARPLAVLSGEEAWALGAAGGGCRLVVDVPGSAPSAAASAPGFERASAGDALSAAYMALGAGYCGVRTLAVVPSGAGRLACEGAAWGAETEVPAVFVLREEPAASGFPGVVLRPRSSAETALKAAEALDLAETWQAPVALLVPDRLRETAETVPVPDFPLPPPRRGVWAADPLPDGPAYDRYAGTPEGVSPRSLPGRPGLEHVAAPWSAEDSRNRSLRRDKLALKEAALAAGTAAGSGGVFVPPQRPLALETEAAAPEAFLGPAVQRGGACCRRTVSAAIARAAAGAPVLPHQTLLLSGMDPVPPDGCPDSLDPARALRCYAVAGLGDRVIPFALGTRLANPSLRTVALGSPRGMSLGWLLDAARANWDLTFIHWNAAPDPAALRDVLSAGCGFAARALAWEEEPLAEVLGRALRHKGFSFVDCVAFCPEHGAGEACARAAKAAYRLDGVGHDPADLEAARRKADEPLDTPPIGVFYEKTGTPLREWADPRSLRSGPAAMLSATRGADEQRSWWEALR